MGIVAVESCVVSEPTSTTPTTKREKIIGYSVEISDRKTVQPFIEKWHYTHSINGIFSDYSFVLLHENIMIGAAIFGQLAMKGVAEKYKKLGYTKVIELRRLVLIDDTLRNAESYFIARMLKWIRQNTDIGLVIAYSDPEQNHTGVVYKASNFVFLGKTAKDHKILFNGKAYHSRALRTRDSRGEYKPFVKRLRQAYESGDAKRIDIEGKLCYAYSVSDKKYRNNTNEKFSGLDVSKRN
jgi:hypothetical protein